MFWLQGYSFGTPRSAEILRRLFEVGARWETGTPDEIADIRRALLRMPHDTFIDVMKLLAMDGYCSPEILRALGRLPEMRARRTVFTALQLPPPFVVLNTPPSCVPA